jgi:hypothetical protein
MSIKFQVGVVLLLALVVISCAAGSTKGKKKKSVVDMTESEIEKIYDEWEVTLFFKHVASNLKKK